MKMDMSGKPNSAEHEPTDEGQYSQEQLEEMLEHYMTAKKIEADPTLLRLVKDFAMSKNKMVEEMFDPNKKQSPIKSLKDVKAKFKDLTEKEAYED